MPAVGLRAGTLGGSEPTARICRVFSGKSGPIRGNIEKGRKSSLTFCARLGCVRTSISLQKSDIRAFRPSDRPASRCSVARRCFGLGESYTTGRRIRRETRVATKLGKTPLFIFSFHKRIFYRGGLTSGKRVLNCPAWDAYTTNYGQRSERAALAAIAFRPIATCRLRGFRL